MHLGLDSIRPKLIESRCFLGVLNKPDTGTVVHFELQVNYCISPNTERIPVKENLACAAENGQSS